LRIILQGPRIAEETRQKYAAYEAVIKNVDNEYSLHDLIQARNRHMHETLCRSVFEREQSSYY